MNYHLLNNSSSSCSKSEILTSGLFFIPHSTNLFFLFTTDCGYVARDLAMHIPDICMHDRYRICTYSNLSLGKSSCMFLSNCGYIVFTLAKISAHKSLLIEVRWLFIFCFIFCGCDSFGVGVL